jgi:DNA-binding response OmpR family regulator
MGLFPSDENACGELAFNITNRILICTPSTFLLTRTHQGFLSLLIELSSKEENFGTPYFVYFPMRILVIEDQKKVAQALQEGLRRNNFDVSVSPDGEEGFFLLNSEHFDLVILDLNLPKRDGIEILKAIRQKRMLIPVLILTARDSLEDRVTGLQSGADDYLVKPFAFPELVARVQALLRRTRQQRDTTLFVADLQLDLNTRKVSRGTEPISLTAKELELIEYLLRHKETVVSREMLARDVWQATMRATPLDNVIDVHIAHLRNKIDGPFELKLLHTVRGVGFILGEEKP